MCRHSHITRKMRLRTTRNGMGSKITRCMPTPWLLRVWHSSSSAAVFGNRRLLRGAGVDPIRNSAFAEATTAARCEPPNPPYECPVAVADRLPRHSYTHRGGFYALAEIARFDDSRIVVARNDLVLPPRNSGCNRGGLRPSGLRFSSPSSITIPR